MCVCVYLSLSLCVCVCARARAHVRGEHGHLNKLMSGAHSQSANSLPMFHAARASVEMRSPIRPNSVRLNVDPKAMACGNEAGHPVLLPPNSGQKVEAPHPACPRPCKASDESSSPDFWPARHDDVTPRRGTPADPPQPPSPPMLWPVRCSEKEGTNKVNMNANQADGCNCKRCPVSVTETQGRTAERVSSLDHV